MKIITPRKRRFRPCPDCGSPLLRRSSEQLSLLITRTLIVCKNPVCGASFTSFEEISYRLSPPSVPNPDINLPMSPHKDRTEIFNALTGQSDAENNADNE